MEKESGCLMQNRFSPLEVHLSRGNTIFGWTYLLLHALVLPILLNLYVYFAPTPPSQLSINLIYYFAGFALVVLLGLRRWLRREFDILLDRLLLCVLLLFAAYFLNNILSMGVMLLLQLLTPILENPNNEAIAAMAGQDYGAMFGLGVFLAPLVEETLFRGVAFGSLYRRHRVAAYMVSMLLFSVYHVWQYALAYGDPQLLLYAVQYLPISFTLCWLYERTGTIWAPTFFHMLINGLSFLSLQIL